MGSSFQKLKLTICSVVDLLSQSLHQAPELHNDYIFSVIDKQNSKIIYGVFKILGVRIL